MKKKTLAERVKKAKEEYLKPHKDPEIILSMINECLKLNKIDGNAYKISPKEINYSDICNKNKTNGEGHIIWVQFVKGGHVAVVGAGKDIGFPKGKRGTWSIIKDVDGVQWETSEVIIVPIRGLDAGSVGIKNVDNVLKCRNGVEHCIGDYLIDNGVPILNFYQHKNYSDDFWLKCKKQCYKIK